MSSLWATVLAPDSHSSLTPHCQQDFPGQWSPYTSLFPKCFVCNTMPDALPVLEKKINNFTLYSLALCHSLPCPQHPSKESSLALVGKEIEIHNPPQFQNPRNAHCLTLPEDHGRVCLEAKPCSYPLPFSVTSTKTCVLKDRFTKEKQIGVY